MSQYRRPDLDAADTQPPMLGHSGGRHTGMSIREMKQRIRDYYMAKNLKVSWRNKFLARLAEEEESEG